MLSAKSPLRRSRENLIIAGVCGGLASYFGVDAIWFRLGFLISLLFGGAPGLIVYFLLWLLIPSEEDN